MAKLGSPAGLERFRQRLISERDPNLPCVTVCTGTGCLAYRAQDVADTFVREIKKQGFEKRISFRPTGCPGFCERGPIVVIFPREICYLGVSIKDVPEIIS